MKKNNISIHFNDMHRKLLEGIFNWWVKITLNRVRYIFWYHNFTIHLFQRRFAFPKFPNKNASTDHNMFLVTDNTAFIGISNWSADYFFDTPGIGLVLQEVNRTSNQANQTIRAQLIELFQRDWNSRYAFA